MASRKSKPTRTTSSAQRRKAPKPVTAAKRKTRLKARRETAAAPPPPVIEGRRDHVALANAYIQDVLSGKIPAGKLVIAACRRQQEDLKRLANHPLYRWNPERGARVCRFLERLPHIKGPKANAKELCVLEGWQCFIVTTIFGWVRKDTGGRRFKRAYVEVPRGNGKSFLSSGIGLYCLAEDGEEGAEVYSAATTREQAKVVWDTAKAMMQKRPDFAQRIGVKVSQYSISQTRSNSKFAALSREANNQDGLNVHCAVIDELHAHRTRDTYDVIETGAGKRPNSLIFIITTAGSDTSGVCYEVRGFVRKVLEGLEDETQFGIIYTIDEEDDWQDPSVWAKANPNWGISVVPDTYASLAFKAMQTPSAQANFKTKHLNVWVNADNPAFDMAAYDRCVDANLKVEDFAGEECFAALDLASKVDIAAKVLLFRRIEKDVTPLPADGQSPAEPATQRKPRIHYYAFLTSYLPEAAILDGRNASYGGWDVEGWLTKTPGDVLDFGTVKDEMAVDSHTFKLREVAYDPWQATQMAQELSVATESHPALTMVEVRPTVQNFSAAMKELQGIMKDGTLHVNANPILRWMVSNTVCHTDAKDNIYPRKEKPENKIDGVVALIMALFRAMVAPPPEPPKVPRIRVLGRR